MIRKIIKNYSKYPNSLSSPQAMIGISYLNLYLIHHMLLPRFAGTERPPLVDTRDRPFAPVSWEQDDATFAKNSLCPDYEKIFLLCLSIIIREKLVCYMDAFENSHAIYGEKRKNFYLDRPWTDYVKVVEVKNILMNDKLKHQYF